jgi:hypothetical protein
MTHEMQGAPAGAPDVHHAVRRFGAVPFTRGFERTIGPRPPLSPIGVLAALAGGLLSLAALLTLAIVHDPSPWAIVGLGALLLVVAWAVAFGAGTVARRGGRPALAELIPLATVTAIAGTLAVAGGLVDQVARSGSPSNSIVWWPALLVALVMFSLWVLPGLQGRPVILGVGLVAGTWALGAFVAVQVATTPRYSSDSGMFVDGSTPSFFSPISDLDALRAAAIAVLGAGLIFLVVATMLDRLHLPGVATPLVVAGVVAAAIGSQGVALDNSVLRALVPLLTAVLVLAIGIIGRRKATSWLGALAAFQFVGQLSLALAGDHPSVGVVAILVAGFGVLALLGALGFITLLPGPGTGRGSDQPVAPTAG